MVTVTNHKTTVLNIDSDEFKIVIKKMLFWQRQNGFFEHNAEKEYEEYEWRKQHFFYGHRTDFEFSNGRKKSLVILNFLIPLESAELIPEEFGLHQEHLNLICEIEDGNYSLIPNIDSVICLHEKVD